MSNKKGNKKSTTSSLGNEPTQKNATNSPEKTLPENEPTWKSEANSPERTSDSSKGRITINVSHHEKLFNILTDTKAFWKLLLTLSAIITIILGGLALIVIVIKKQFPYNTIKTTSFGATIIQDEDKDVIYWLYNTSDLWANTGVYVKEGDAITIRASGAVHMAIHHLVYDSQSNDELEYNWIDTNGSKTANKTKRDSIRSQFRLYPSGDWGMLLMKILTGEEAKLVGSWKNANETNKKRIDSLLTFHPYIEPIGKERHSIIATREGYLHFTLNDIILTDSVINRMYKEFLDEIKNRISKSVYDSLLFKIKGGTANKDNVEQIVKNGEIENWDSLCKWVNNDSNGINPGAYYDKKNGENYDKKNGEKGKDSASGYPFVNDFLYYKEKGFKDAWYVDNVGSFLLVIEIKRKK